MKNKILKPLPIATLLAIVPLTISSAYAAGAKARPNSFKLLNICGAAKNKPCKIGETGPAGGIIFYVDNLNQHPFGYLEAAPSTLRPAASNWCINSNLIGTTAGLLGNGKADSGTVSAGCGAEVSSSAAKLASIEITPDSSVLNSSPNWYLPSITELQLMKTNASVQLGWKKGTTTPTYWSSTEVAPTPEDLTTAPSAWAMNSLDGSASPVLKTDILEILPIRSFGN